ncbi:5-bromo-4-chloroindolyl phosphate hydrolysis protein [Photorhabdus australis subsp. thailandensis]|uniref:5-bromo-4-chloroindolyl phosphate hydrolysis protein n=1 Tax=Photorhabdus australis subsp. thailandensis TaxID=2805096 RepID=A0A1C0U2Z0_9GAMM|nr:5-bromo-4-chloroindolyl phosphate hydrolysis family protein [Photorhabdus australis]OCQ52251.1 5-bromo-4-chloroindolyl phosphate hydrolysis protein [Photorhabdus australis subsp. thailandensis]
MPTPQSSADHDVAQQQEQEELSLFDSIKQSLSRVLFHIKVFVLAFTLACVALFTPWSFLTLPADNHHISSMILLSGYIGLLALYPPRPNRLATLAGWLVVVLSPLAGLWAVALSFGGVATLLITIIRQRKLEVSRFPLLLIAALIIVLLFRMDTHAIPVWFGIAFFAIVLIGAFIESWHHLRRQKALRRQQQIAARQQAEEQRRQDEALAEFAEYYEQLAQITSYKSGMTYEIQELVSQIEEKTQAIIGCMQADARDVTPGKLFLNRYLPMLVKSLERCISLKEHNANSAQFEEVRLLTYQGMREMSTAFSEMHQRLLDNDIDDLRVDLKVMNQLIRSQGFGAKHDQKG